MVPEMSRIQGIQGGDAHEIIPLGNFGSSIIHLKKTPIRLCYVKKRALMIRIRKKSRLIWLIRIHKKLIYVW
jgi:hypothetical protein